MSAPRRLQPNIAAWLLLACTPGLAAAQFSTTVDAGWATIRYDEYLRTGVFTLSPALRLDFPRTFLSARGTLSQFESGSTSADLSLAGSTFSRPFGPLRIELSGGGGGTIYNGLGTGHVSGGLRVHALASRAGLWVGGSGGYVDDGIIGSFVERYAAGGWTRLGSWSLSTVAQHQNAELFSVTDLEGALRLNWGAFNLAASAGARAGGNDLIGARRWGELASTIWFGRHFAFVAAHGRYPSEPGRGTPGGSYTTLSLRYATRPPLQDLSTARGERSGTPTVARPVVAGFNVKKEGDSTYVLTARAPGASRVEVTGDFTDWQEKDMDRAQAADNFSFRIKLAPGAHKFTIRVDAGNWGVPPGVPVLKDEFTGHVALLIIQ